MCNSVIWDIFIEVCYCHHNQFRMFSPSPKETPYPLAVIPHCLPISWFWTTTNALSVACMHVWMHSHFGRDRIFMTLWTVAHQAPLSMGFSRQEYWSGLPCPPPGDLADPGLNPCLLRLLHGGAEPPGKSFLSLDLPLLGILCQYNHMHGLLWLVSFTYNVLKVSCWMKYQCFILLCLSNTPFYSYTTVYPFISWWTLGYFCLLTYYLTIIKNNAAMNIYVWVFVWTSVFISLGHIGSSETAGLTFWWTAKLFSSVFYIFTSNPRGSQFLHILANICCFLLFCLQPS